MYWKVAPGEVDDVLEEITKWRIRHWCNECENAPNKKKHMQFHPKAKDLPPEDAIIRQRLPADFIERPVVPVAAAVDGDAAVAAAVDADAAVAAAVDADAADSSSSSSSSESSGS